MDPQNHFFEMVNLGCESFLALVDIYRQIF